MILKAVSKISNCQGDITSGWGIKQLGIPLILFASIFYESCQRTQGFKSSRLPAKIVTYLVSFGQLLCLAFLCGLRFFILNERSLDWPLTLTTQLSTSKLSDNPGPTPS